MLTMSIEDIVKNKNIKLTTARVSLLKIFKEAKRPLSYEDIKADISMDKATFYRNITKFEQESVLNSFESNDKKRYFELKATPHAHFVCIKCNAVECIKNFDCVNNFAQKLEGYEINNIIINGICKKCK